MTDQILEQSTHPLGAHYLARSADGTYLAGRDNRTARRFKSPQDVYEAFYPQASEGVHWAWNICYAAEGLIAGASRT